MDPLQWTLSTDELEHDGNVGSFRKVASAAKELVRVDSKNQTAWKEVSAPAELAEASDVSSSVDSVNGEEIELMCHSLDISPSRESRTE